MSASYADQIFLCLVCCYLILINLVSATFCVLILPGNHPNTDQGSLPPGQWWWWHSTVLQLILHYIRHLHQLLWSETPSQLQHETPPTAPPPVSGVCPAAGPGWARGSPRPGRCQGWWRCWWSWWSQVRTFLRKYIVSHSDIGLHHSILCVKTKLRPGLNV